MNRARLLRVLWISFPIILLLSGCLAGPSSPYAAGTAQAGFFVGVFHGVISPFTLIASFLSESVRMVEGANATPQYDMGFLFGVVVVAYFPFLVRIALRSRRRL
jgi:hypothetical protein